MLDETKRDFMCGFPYQLSIQQGLLFSEDVESDMLETDFSELKWSINISVLLKPIEPVACRVCCLHDGANRGKVTVAA